MKFLWKSNTKENFRQMCHIFLATDLTKAPLEQDPDESIEVYECSLDEAIDRVLSSPNIHFPSAVALLKYQREQARK